MSLDKNISINAPNCKSCEPVGDITISPTLFTDKEVTYKLHEHKPYSCDCDHESGGISSEELDEKISKAVQEKIFAGEEYPSTGKEGSVYIDTDDGETAVWDETLQQYVTVSNYVEDATEEDIEKMFA